MAVNVILVTLSLLMVLIARTWTNAWTLEETFASMEDVLTQKVNKKRTERKLISGYN